MFIKSVCAFRRLIGVPVDVCAGLEDGVDATCNQERESECDALLLSNFSSPVTMANRLASRVMKRPVGPPKTKRQAMKRPAGRPKMARKVSIVVDRWWDWIGFGLWVMWNWVCMDQGGVSVPRKMSNHVPSRMP